MTFYYPVMYSPQCPFCHNPFIEILNGKVKCPYCYVNYKTELAILLARIHGSAKHIGKKPNRLLTQAELQKMLKEAIKSENYEKAAKYRDLINKLIV